MKSSDVSLEITVLFLCQREAREWVQQHACAIKSEAAGWGGCTFIPSNIYFSEITKIEFASTGVGDKVVKDIRPGVPFEPTYIYKLLTLIKSSLSEKVNSLISVLMGLDGLIRCLDIFKMFALVIFPACLGTTRQKYDDGCMMYEYIIRIQK